MSRFTLLPKVHRRAFTIVELLAATAVFIGLMLLLVTATGQTSELWRRSSAKIEQFQQGRRAFESMTRHLSQATLNTYWDYSYPLKPNGDPDREKVPTGYLRQSELRFRTGTMESIYGKGDGIPRPTHSVFFQAPIGLVEPEDPEVSLSNPHKPLNNLLNTWGYFLEVNDDSTEIPPFLRTIIPPRTRSRIMELMVPSETISIDNPSQMAGGTAMDANWNKPWAGWYAEPIKLRKDRVRVLAENVVALIILPRLTPQDEADRAVKGKKDLLCPVFDYDSKRLSNQKNALGNPNLVAPDPEINPKNQLPPVLTVNMVLIDETSARRLAAMTENSRDLGLGLNNLFQDSSLLTDNPRTTASGDGDLAALENTLITKRLNYRIFSSNVLIRGAKWSRSQTK